MKRARIYRRGSRLYFHAVSRTAEGAWVMAAPFIGVEDGAAETFFGETLARVLASSRFGARDPGDGSALRQQLLDLARARTWTLFMKRTTVCDVERDETEVRFHPSRSGARRPFVPATSSAVTIGVGRGLSASPSLRTGQADFPHPALQSVVPTGNDD